MNHHSRPWKTGLLNRKSIWLQTNWRHAAAYWYNLNSFLSCFDVLAFIIISKPAEFKHAPFFFTISAWSEISHQLPDLKVRILVTFSSTDHNWGMHHKMCKEPKVFSAAVFLTPSYWSWSTFFIKPFISTTYSFWNIFFLNPVLLVDSFQIFRNKKLEIKYWNYYKPVIVFQNQHFFLKVFFKKKPFSQFDKERKTMESWVGGEA